MLNVTCSRKQTVFRRTPLGSLSCSGTVVRASFAIYPITRGKAWPEVCNWKTWSHMCNLHTPYIPIYIVPDRSIKKWWYHSVRSGEGCHGPMAIFEYVNICTFDMSKKGRCAIILVAYITSTRRNTVFIFCYFLWRVSSPREMLWWSKQHIVSYCIEFSTFRR